MLTRPLLGALAVLFLLALSRSLDNLGIMGHVEVDLAVLDFEAPDAARLLVVVVPEATLRRG
jgi:hypothetical protein